MGPYGYIEKFERVVDLLRVTGNYTAVLQLDGTYEVTSNVSTYLKVGDYLRLSGLEVRTTAIISDKIFRVDPITQVIDLAGVWKAMAPYSDYGTRRTINMKLLQKNGAEYSYQKYPLIALRFPAPIRVTGDVATMNANILVAHFTNKTYRPEERVANTFDPILWPMTQAFLTMVKKSGEFSQFNHDYTQIDRMFFGTESGDENIANIFEDPLDAVEIRDLNLTFFTDGCWPAPPLGGGFEYLFEKVFEA